MSVRDSVVFTQSDPKSSADKKRPKPQTLISKSQTIMGVHRRSTQTYQPKKRDLKPQPKRLILNPKHSTLNPKPSSLNPNGCTQAFDPKLPADKNRQTFTQQDFESLSVSNTLIGEHNNGMWRDF